MESVESNAESAETCHRKVATSTLKVATSSQKMATSMLKVASDIYKTPLYRTAHSLRTPQTSGHSSFRISDLPLWSLKPPSSQWLKLSFFICPRVSARFLHCFCTVSRDAMGTLTCKIRQRVQKLHSEKSRCSVQKRRKLESFKIRVTCPVGSFNQRAKDSSSLERTKEKQTIGRKKCGANRGLFCFYMLKMGRKMRQI